MSKDKFEGTIVGTVERVRQYAKGDVVTLAIKTNPNAQYPDRVTVWAVGDAPVAEGQRVSVSGQVSWKSELYNDKPRTQVSVNFPTWGLGGGDAAAAEVVSAAPVVDAFNDESVPF